MNERQEKIYRIILKLGNASIEHLQKEVFASPATIRRDLKKLEQENLILRVWGGASALSNIDSPSFIRETENLEAKRRIARKAISFISENDCIFLSSGSSLTELCKVLHPFNNLTIITTCLNVVEILKKNYSFKIMMVGGELHENYDFVGPIAKNTINKFSANVFFFSCTGITADGFTSKNLLRLDNMQSMQENSTKTILLCDSSKVGKRYMYKGFGFDKIDYVIMEKEPNDKDLVKALGKKLIIV